MTDIPVSQVRIPLNPVTHSEFTWCFCEEQGFWHTRVRKIKWTIYSQKLREKKKSRPLIYDFLIQTVYKDVFSGSFTDVKYHTFTVSYSLVLPKNRVTFSFTSLVNQDCIKMSPPRVFMVFTRKQTVSSVSRRIKWLHVPQSTTMNRVFIQKEHTFSVKDLVLSSEYVFTITCPLPCLLSVEGSYGAWGFRWGEGESVPSVSPGWP